MSAIELEHQAQSPARAKLPGRERLNLCLASASKVTARVTQIGRQSSETALHWRVGFHPQRGCRVYHTRQTAAGRPNCVSVSHVRISGSTGSKGPVRGPLKARLC